MHGKARSIGLSRLRPRLYYEIEDRGDEHDLLSVSGPSFSCRDLKSDSKRLLRRGFITAVSYVLRCKEDALVFGGPPCGPWVWVNSGTHGRYSNIWGKPSAYVRNANKSLGSVFMSSELPGRGLLLVGRCFCCSRQAAASTL